MDAPISRRNFVAGAVAASTLAYSTTKSSAQGSNERVRLGVIGVGNRGDQLIDYFLPHKDCEIVAVCDVYEPYLEFAKKKVGGKAETYADYRKLLDNKNIDAVVIATPDHWHALNFIDACKAGKDIYTEKPTSLVVAEGRKMVNVANETKRIVQVGLQRRTCKFIAEAIERIHAGDIGKVTLAKVFCNRNEFPMGIGKPADSAPPKGLDWDMWLGPAPKVPFNENRCLYKFRWFWDYSGGQLTNLGTHYIDVIHRALKNEVPTKIAALGGRYALEDNREVPDTLECIWQYGDTIVALAQHNTNDSIGSAKHWEVEFQGTKGTLGIRPNGYDILPEENRTAPIPARTPLNRKEVSAQERMSKLTGEPVSVAGRVNATEHARNFLDCVKARKFETNCPIETGHRSSSATLLANVALRLGHSIEWDGKAEKIVGGDAAASKLLSYEYRKPWSLG